MFFVLTAEIVTTTRFTGAQPLSRRGQWSNYPPGVSFDPNTCNEAQRQIVLNAITDAQTLIRAGKEVLQSQDRTLFNYFFDHADYPVVNTAFHNVYNRLLKLDAPVPIFCSAPPGDNTCIEDDAIAFMAINWMILRDESSAIFLCPRFWQLPSLPDPCQTSSLLWSGEPEGKARAGNVVHELLHAPLITGKLWSAADIVGSAHDCHLLANQDPALAQSADARPTFNVYNFAILTQWAWVRDMQQRDCPSAYPLWGILAPEPEDGYEHPELRKLLNASDVAAPQVGDDVVECTSSSNDTACSTLNPLGTFSIGN